MKETPTFPLWTLYYIIIPLIIIILVLVITLIIRQRRIDRMFKNPSLTEQEQSDINKMIDTDVSKKYEQHEPNEAKLNNLLTGEEEEIIRRYNESTFGQGNLL